MVQEQLNEKLKDLANDDEIDEDVDVIIYDIVGNVGWIVNRHEKGNS